MAPRPPRSIASRLRLRVRVMVRMSADDHQLIRQRATEAGETFSTYLRRAALGRVPRVVPPVNWQTQRALGSIGNNLNQLARRMNQGGEETPGVEELVPLVVELLELLKETRRAMLGVEAL
jgi:hypothetical protein